MISSETLKTPIVKSFSFHKALDAYSLLGSWMSCICCNRSGAGAGARLTGRPAPEAALFLLEIRPSQIFTVFFTWNLILKLISLWIPRLFSKFFGRQLKFMSKTDKTGYPVNVTLPVQIQICRFTLQPLQLLNNLSKAARN